MVWPVAASLLEEEKLEEPPKRLAGGDGGRPLRRRPEYKSDIQDTKQRLVIDQLSTAPGRTFFISGGGASLIVALADFGETGSDF